MIVVTCRRSSTSGSCSTGGRAGNSPWHTPRGPSAGDATDDEVIEAVAAVDAHVLRDRARGRASGRDCRSAWRNGTSATSRCRAATSCIWPRKLVEVGRLAVQQLAEQPQAAEVQAEQFLAAVAAVLHHHAVLPRPLGRLHQLPAFVERDAGGHLREGVLAGIHRIHAHPRVPLPRRGDDHDVDVVALEHPLVIFVAVAVGGRRLCGRPLAALAQTRFNVGA